MTNRDQAGMTTYDKNGIPIERGDIVKVFHFTGARRKRHYMFKQCLGVNTYPNGTQEYLFFSHLNFADLIGEKNGPYHERLGTHLDHYEIVQSVKCDHERRECITPAGRAALANGDRE